MFDFDVKDSAIIADIASGSIKSMASSATRYTLSNGVVLMVVNDLTMPNLVRFGGDSNQS